MDSSCSQIGERFIVFWLEVLISQDILDNYMFNKQGKLTASDLFPLTFSSKSVSNIVRRYIEKNMWFKVECIDSYSEPKEIKTLSRLIWYAPKKISSSEGISYVRLFDRVLPSFSISHLKFHNLTDWSRRLDNIPRQVLPLVRLPRTLTHIEFGNLFDSPIQENDLPASLTHCKFGDRFSQDISHLPHNIVHLIFGWSFTEIVDGLLPPKLRYVEFEFRFKQTIDCLPASLTSVCFKTRTKDLWPNNFLSFGFNLPINSLPSSLTHLELGVSFNKNIDCLPYNLTHLQLRGEFNKPIDHLPYSLLFLGLSESFNLPVDSLPHNLTRLEFNRKFNLPVSKLPPHLSFLIFGAAYNQITDKLPQKITHLKFGSSFSQPLNTLPFSLTHLEFFGSFNQPIDGLLPPNLTYLYLGSPFEKTLDQLPITLTHLIIDSVYFSHPIDHLPPNLTHLKLNFEIKHPLETLPLKITHLWLSVSFDQPLLLPLHTDLKKVSIQSYDVKSQKLMNSLDQFKKLHPNAEIKFHQGSSSDHFNSTKNNKVNPNWEREFVFKWEFLD